MERPRTGRGLGYGLAAVLAVAVVGALLRGILDLTGGLIARRRRRWLGHRRRGPHGVVGRPGASAVIARRRSSRRRLGALGWLATLVGAWLVSMAILPASSRSFPDRLVATPFLDWVGPQLGLADVLALLLFIGFAWFGARSAATRA